MASAATFWICTQCTFENDAKYSRCNMCHIKRDINVGQSTVYTCKKCQTINHYPQCQKCYWIHVPSDSDEEGSIYSKDRSKKPGVPYISEQGTDETAMRIVLLGKTGSGKSSSGNTILGKSKHFNVVASAQSVTTNCEKGTASRFGTEIEVVDTPGLFYTGMSHERMAEEIAKCIVMTSPGPHAFVLVLQINKYTAEEQQTVALFEHIFGQEMYRFSVVLFTRTDDLAQHDITLDDYVTSAPPELKNLLQRCGNRYIGFDNSPPADDQEDNARALFNMAQNLDKPFFTNEIFSKASSKLSESKGFSQADDLSFEIKSLEVRKTTMRDDSQQSVSTRELKRQMKEMENQIKDLKLQLREVRRQKSGSNTKTVAVWYDQSKNIKAVGEVVKDVIKLVIPVLQLFFNFKR